MVQGGDVRGDGRGWSGRESGRVVVVVGAECCKCTWGWAWVEWRGSGRESGGSGSIGVRGWVEGWMSGMKCMDINGFLGDDDVLMVL
mgnify:CR=1 FL=1